MQIHERGSLICNFGAFALIGWFAKQLGRCGGCAGACVDVRWVCVVVCVSDTLSDLSMSGANYRPASCILNDYLESPDV